ncbi:MAG: hypothetical protein RL427_1234 [Bacteroidota bacterium]|jgi:hypothetical protein
MQPINGLYAIFAVLFIVTACLLVLVLPYTLRFFRIPRIFNGTLLLFIVMLLVGIGIQFQDNFNCDERHMIFYPLYIISFLLLYKLCDTIVLKKLNRNMYYLTPRGITDEESQNSTIAENIMQFAIIAISFYFPYLISSWILKLWFGC